QLPVKQQVVIVEKVLALLDLHIASIEARQLVAPLAAPREAFFQRPRERVGGVDSMRIDREARVLARETLLLLRTTELLPDQLRQVRRVAAVEHRERRLDAENLRVLAQKAIADRVIGAGPEPAGSIRNGGARTACTEDLPRDPLRTTQHLLSRSSREREQQDALRR